MATMDQTSFMVHQVGDAAAAATTAGQPMRSGFHGGIHHGQQHHHGHGCPYLCGEQQQQQQQRHHQPSLPPPHPQLHLHPVSHQLPHQLSQQLAGPQQLPHPRSSAAPLLPSPNGNHFQQQHQHQHQPQQQAQQQQPPQQPPTHPQTGNAQQLPPLNHIQGQLTLPYPHPHSHSHPVYDHLANPGSGGGSWSAGPRSGTPWPEPTSQATHPTYLRPLVSEPYFGPAGTAAGTGQAGTAVGPGAAPGAGTGPGAGLGPVPPSLLPNPSHQPIYSPHHEHWTQVPLSLQAYHRPTIYPRFPPAIPPGRSHTSLLQHHRRRSHSSYTSTPNNQSQSQSQFQSTTLHPTTPTMNSDRGGPMPPARGANNSSVNQNQGQNATSAFTRRHAGPSMPGRPPILPGEDDVSSTANMQLPRPPPFMLPESPHRASVPNSRQSVPALDYPVFSASFLRHLPPGADLPISNAIDRLGQNSDFDSEDDSAPDDEEQVYRYVQEFSVGHPHFRNLSEEHIRAAQLLRGQLSNKRVASKKALAQLESVDIQTLPESERTCVICYNAFGKETPEGILESPLRLPKCKHVFGDHCIKKWLEEADTCPYCRDKLPSEPMLPPQYRELEALFRARARGRRFSINQSQLRHETANTNSTGRRSPPGEADETRRTRARRGSVSTPQSIEANASPGRASSSRTHQSRHQANAANPPQPPPAEEDRQFFHMTEMLWEYNNTRHLPPDVVPPPEPSRRPLSEAMDVDVPLDGPTFGVLPRYNMSNQGENNDADQSTTG
ncbi:hypothetical protein VTK26DRAFT_2810 [Humicola hyalothermophila]